MELDTPSNHSATEEIKLSVSASWKKCLEIKEFGPSSPAEYSVYEFLQYCTGNPAHQYIIFSLASLHLATMVLRFKHEAPESFWADLDNIIDTLPISENQVIERSILIDLLYGTAKELNMYWSEEWWFRMGVLCTIMEAAGYQRKEKHAQEDAAVKDLIGAISITKKRSTTNNKAAKSVVKGAGVKKQVKQDRPNVKIAVTNQPKEIKEYPFVVNKSVTLSGEELAKSVGTTMAIKNNHRELIEVIAQMGDALTLSA